MHACIRDIHTQIHTHTHTHTHTYIYIYIYICKKKVKWSRYRPGVAQRVDRGIALLFHDRGTRRGWAVSSTPRPNFTPGKEPVPISLEAGLAPGPVWTGGKISSPPGFDPGPSSRSQSLYRLSYPAHTHTHTHTYTYTPMCLGRWTFEISVLFSSTVK